MGTEIAKILNNFIDKLPVILPSVVAIVTLAVGYKTGKRQSSLNLITSGRIDWQETIRNELADYIGAVLSHYNRCLKASQIGGMKADELQLAISEISNITAKGNRLILRLNYTDDIKIIEIIKEINKLEIPSQIEGIKKMYAELNTQISILVSESHAMLKKEWEKIKAEAGHKRRRKLPN